MPETIAYGHKRRLPSVSYDTALQKLPEELKKEGFGILTVIDVKDTLKKKLDKDFRRYTILGACNPPFAYSALSAEMDIGVFMPCNVVVYEEGQGSVITAIDPRVSLGATGRTDLQGLAEDVAAKLRAAVDRVSP